MTSDAIIIPARVTPELLTAYVTALGLDVRLANHGAPGVVEPDLPTATLSDGTVVVIGNGAGRDMCAEPRKRMAGRLRAHRYSPAQDRPGVPDYGKLTDVFLGTPAEVLAELLTWSVAASGVWPVGDGGVRQYSVDVQVSFSVSVPVTAASAEKAAGLVNRKDFGLPGIDEWHRHNDWWYRVYGQDSGEPLYEADR